jgi:hypothetical protein
MGDVCLSDVVDLLSVAVGSAADGRLAEEGLPDANDGGSVEG